MSATRRAATTSPQEREAPNLLDEVIARMETIEARQLRPSPIHLRSWEEIERFAEKAARSGMVPAAYKGSPDMIVIAVQMGSELGLPPMQSLQNIAVINGRPSVWGDAMPALCRASGMARSIREWSKGDDDALTYYCEAIRKDDPNPIAGRFSVADAKKAGLWGKTGPWQQYAGRMLQMRARGFCLRDAFPDVLRGLISAEEASDIPFEATGLMPRQEPEPEAAKPSEPKQTVSQWLTRLGLELSLTQTPDQVDAILSRADVQKAQDALRNGAKDQLQSLIDSAIARANAMDTGAPNEEEPADATSP